MKLVAVQQQVDAVRRHALDELVEDAALRHEAARRHTTPDALLREDAAKAAAPVTDASVEQFFEAHAQTLQGQGAPAEICQAIRIALEQQQPERAALRRSDAAWNGCATPISDATNQEADVRT